jgi:hypothetical protein
MPVGTDLPSKPEQKTILTGFAILLASLIRYWPAFNSGFIWDDNTYLTANHQKLYLSGQPLRE